ncbi:hypothetical protein B0H14DRAFT_3726447 [Mycena olivaceomarginata]|nr:hypothetical protein B0H14DRAFT_3726447 [Mycena olivaceomarginata]
MQRHFCIRELAQKPHAAFGRATSFHAAFFFFAPVVPEGAIDGSGDVYKQKTAPPHAALCSRMWICASSLLPLPHYPIIHFGIIAPNASGLLIILPELQQSQKFLPTQSLNARFYRMVTENTNKSIDEHGFSLSYLWLFNSRKVGSAFFGSTTTQRQAAWDYYGCANYPNFVKRNNNKEIEGEPPMKRAKDDVAKKRRGQSSSLRGRRRQRDLKDKRVISYIYDGSETLETMFGELQSVGNDDRDIRAGVAKAEEMWSRNGRRGTVRGSGNGTSKALPQDVELGAIQVVTQTETHIERRERDDTDHKGGPNAASGARSRFSEPVLLKRLHVRGTKLPEGYPGSCSSQAHDIPANSSTTTNTPRGSHTKHVLNNSDDLLFLGVLGSA